LLPLGLHGVFKHRSGESGVDDALAAVNLCVAIRALGWNSATQCRYPKKLTRCLEEQPPGRM
jgi:hypothetical protein